MPVVKVEVANDDPSDTKLIGATVYFYNTTGVFQTSGVTNSSGIATVTLPIESYDIFVYYQAYSLIQPQRIIVDSLLENSFSVVGHLRILPEPMDTNLCRVSGYLIDITGQPVKNVELVFQQYPYNIVVTNYLGYNQPTMIKSNENGYFEFDLIRSVKYVTSYALYDGPLLATVAEIPSVHLHSLLFPIPASTSVSSSTITIPLSSGPNTTISTTTTFTDYNTATDYCNKWSSVKVVSSDPTIVGVEFSGAGHIKLIPMRIGTATISFVRELNSDYYWRNIPAFISHNVIVTIT